MSCYKEMQDEILFQKKLSSRWKELYIEQWGLWIDSQKEVNLLKFQLSKLKQELQNEKQCLTTKLDSTQTYTYPTTTSSLTSKQQTSVKEALLDRIIKLCYAHGSLEISAQLAYGNRDQIIVAKLYKTLLNEQIS